MSREISEKKVKEIKREISEKERGTKKKARMGKTFEKGREKWEREVRAKGGSEKAGREGKREGERDVEREEGERARVREKGVREGEAE